MPRVKSPERLEFLHDVMVTALEGGVGYWSVADKIVRHENDRLWYASYVLFCEDPDEPKEAGECGLSTKEKPVPVCQGHLINPDAIARAMGLVRDPNNADIGWHISQRRHVIEANRENDAGEIDAGDADCIVQISAFGTVVYQ